MKQFLSALFVAATILTMAFVTHKDTSVPHTPLDTPQWRKRYVVANPNQYITSRDTLQMIVRTLGKTLTKEEADNRTAYALHLIELMDDSHRVDSVLVEQKSISKPKNK